MFELSWWKGLEVAGVYGLGLVPAEYDDVRTQILTDRQRT